ncbi:tRNA (adenosine(37)-N6)-threonylcarbamoyltransferase complex transferase subunit TsaD [bacterium]|nr:tRNA (adenosine(37)-N6)-threonylcarbamoyltransferase complex transferase subunit TsaD [bacterium]QQR56391.1 MAG: tRNA (adenosine(37)-N6)-threonylcarbamoyltransferase complex transferase subunit TsaD [Candidatus Melainabacteria bacterium]
MTLILGLETSCDETACAIVQDGRKLVAQSVKTQALIHQTFGGVIPEVAARHHLEAINEVIDDVLHQSKIDKKDLTAIACTNGPGFVGALLVGLSAAKAIAWSWSKPLIAVDHLFAHVCANYIDTTLEPPFLCLLVSGGHTQLVHFCDYQTATILGQTLDDAVGEAYDKVARMLGLGYPGGPAIDNLARGGNPDAFALPEGNVDQFDFSYSGLKTAVLRTIEKLEKNIDKNNNPDNLPLADLAASFQKAANQILVKKTLQAAKQLDLSTVVLAGGVAANSDLRKRFSELSEVKVFMPPLKYCTDNAVMVAACAHFMNTNAQMDISVYSRQKRKNR